MRTVIEVINIKNGNVVNSLFFDNVVSATHQLKNIPDQCAEEEANFEHRHSSVHHAGVKQHMESVFTKFYFKDTSNRIF